MEAWERLVVVCAVILAAAVLAKLVDMRMARRELPPEAATRYRVLRRSLMGAIIFVGVLSALFVIPQVRAVAGGLLASSAILGLVIGLAAQRTLSNFVAGVMIGLSQPIRLGDRVGVQEGEGVVEEIGLVYTRIRQDDRTRLVIPNDRLASDTIRNSTIVSRERLAEITVPVPRDKDLQAVVDLLRDVAAPSELLVTGLDGDAVVTLRAWADDEASAQQLESELRLRVQSRLREAGADGGRRRTPTASAPGGSAGERARGIAERWHLSSRPSWSCSASLPPAGSRARRLSVLAATSTVFAL